LVDGRPEGSPAPKFGQDTLIQKPFPADETVMTAVRLLVLAPIILGTAFAQRVGAPTDDLDKLSVDELFTLQVTSVGRKAQQLSKAPAAVFVLTAEDIKRSGATSIPEALQWVPGLTVLRLDGRSWVVSARGSARLYSDKILVMIDGRSLYTPLFSGVIWDSIDVPLLDIEQIEVVRGPGAVMWGPNAVNGVINIITKRAKATKGAVVSVATGNELRGANEARWGAAPSDRLSYRVWEKLDYRTPAYGSPGLFYFNTSGTYTDPSIKNLDSATGRFGFRFEGQPGPNDQWMVQGDVYKTDRQDPLAYAVLLPLVVNRVQGHTDYEGGSIQARWTHSASAGRESELQFTYSKNNLNYPYLGGDINNATIDYQNRVQTGERNEFYWGAGFQQYWDSTYASASTGFNPRSAVYRVGDVVLRDEWQIVPNRLLGSAGVRIDYNTYHDVEYQPSFRLLYTPSARQSAWIALSRAVRVPSRFDRDIQVNRGESLIQGIPIALQMTGSTAMRSEVERSIEMGHRLQSGQRWSIDASLFWSYYERLRALQGPLVPLVSFVGKTPQFAIPSTDNNSGSGRSYGGEVWAMWQVRSGWRLIPSYSYLNETRWLPAQTAFRYAFDGLPANLRHQALLRSQHDLSRTVQVDLMAKARSRDLALGLPGAFLIDARLSWRPTTSGEFSVSLQNLTDRRILESYPEAFTPAIPLRRTFVLKWTQRI
jgi:iron complex outermembrane receptor protein